MQKTSHFNIADYDKSGYDYTSFWKDRQYEDRSEKRLLQKLLPKSGEAILDIGGGYGRLSLLYTGIYKRAVLLDYSRTNLEKASLLAEQKGWKNLETWQGDVYQLPFRAEEFDTVLMVRLLHHLESPAIALAEVARVLKPDGTLLLEFPNKIHLKARLRHWWRRDWGFTHNLAPCRISGGCSLKPTANLATAGIIYNYHPEYVINLLGQVGLTVTKQRAASSLRLPLLKTLLPLGIHLGIDALVEPFFAFFSLSPSLIYRCQKLK